MAPMEVVLILYHLYPEGAFCPDSEGATPLHWAATHQNVEVIFKLVSLAPSVCKVENNQGEVPLHSLLSSWDGPLRTASREDVAALVDLMIKSYPNALLLRRSTDGMNPAGCARLCDYPCEILDVIEENYPETQVWQWKNDLSKDLEDR